MTTATADPVLMTELVLTIFRANARLLGAGDQLVAPLSLTSARWQLLGAIASAREPLSVSGLSRSMNVTRQANQRIINDLEDQGLVTFAVNPRHRRAHLVVLTDKGHAVFEQAMALQRPWVTELGTGLTNDQVATSIATLQSLWARLGGTQENANRATTSARDDEESHIQVTS